MPAREPSVRASLVSMVLRRASEVWPGDAAALRAALGPEALFRLERLPGHGWVPYADEVAIIRAVHARHGDEGARRLGLEIGRVGVTHPLLRPVATATLAMLGRRPHLLAEIVPASWRLATHAAGRVSVGRGAPGEVHFEHDGIPEILRDRGVMLRFGGSAEGVLELAGLETSLAVEWEPGASFARMRVSWRRRG